MWAVAAAIVLLAAGLRFAWPTQVNWDSDTALHYLRAAELARGERLELMVGFRTHAGGARLSPLFHYLLTGPALLGRGPLPVIHWVGLVDLSVVLILVVAGPRVWGARVALLAGLAYAVLADPVARCRSLHNETFLGPLLLLVLLACARARRRPDSAASGLGLAALVAMPQLHLSAVFALPALAAGLAPPLRRAGLRRCLPGLLLCALISAPFLLHETRRGFAESRALLHGAGGADQPGEPGESVHAQGRERVLRGALSLARVLGTDDAWELLGPSLTAEVRESWTAPLRGAAAVSAWLVPALGLCGLGLCLTGRAGPALRQVGLIASATLLTCALIGVRAVAPYVVQLAPLGCLLAAAAAAAAWRACGGPGPAARGARVALTGVLALGLAGQAALAGAGVRAVAARGGAADRPYRLTYATTRAAADWVLERPLAVGRFPAWQHCLMLDVAWRALPPARQAGFEPRRAVLPYWDLPYLLPVPRGPFRVVALEELDPGAPPPGGTLARFGPLIVREEPGQ